MKVYQLDGCNLTETLASSISSSLQTGHAALLPEGATLTIIYIGQHRR